VANQGAKVNVVEVKGGSGGFVSTGRPLIKDGFIQLIRPTSRKIESSFNIGDKLKCDFGNSGNKFWAEQLKPFVVVSDIKYHSSGIPKLKFEGIDSYFFENDFSIYHPEPLFTKEDRKTIFELEAERFAWSKATFGEATALAGMHKLIGEAKEIIADIECGTREPIEYADALMVYFRLF